MREVFGDSSRNGEWVAVRLLVDGDTIFEADAPGLDRDLTGLTLLEAAAVGGETSPGRVAVAMSGGVDSAVALLRSLPNAVGVTLRLWLDPDGPDSERACCSPESVIAARETCHRLGVPHVTLDLREEFRRAVVTPFVRGYARGETPNPCTRCNGGFRFAELLAFARRAGAERLATGHYARVVERDGRPLLARGTDPAKDQSYMLAAIDPRQLSRVSFPLGEQDKEATRGAADLEKDQSYMLARLDPRRLDRLWFPLADARKENVRAEAERAGLAVARRAESQEACFLAGDDYRAFLGRHGLEPRDGSIVGEDGRELGRHDGFWRFTPGQRRGLGLAAPEPLYVLGTQPSANAVVVGPRASLARTEVTARGRLYAEAGRVEVKLRYRSPAVPARVEPTARGFRLELDEPAYGVAAGQAAVLYDRDTVVGYGLITASH